VNFKSFFSLKPAGTVFAPNFRLNSQFGVEKRLWESRRSVFTLVFLVSVKRFPCDHCDTGFMEKWKLKNHIKIVHEKTRQFKCEECQLTFAYNSLLKHHKCLFKYRCANCDKTFGHTTQLSRHVEKCLQKVDQNSEDFELHLSDDEAFYQEPDVTLTEKSRDVFFMEQQQESAEKISNENQNLKCYFPGDHSDDKEYMEKYQLKIHVKVVLEKIRQFKCVECQLTFCYKEMLKKHKCCKFRCDNCDKTFAFKNHWSIHAKKCQQKLDERTEFESELGNKEVLHQKPYVTLTEKPRDVFMKLPQESAEKNYTLKEPHILVQDLHQIVNKVVQDCANEPHKIVHQLNENMKKAMAKELVNLSRREFLFYV
jgi:hypothetical protein